MARVLPLDFDLPSAGLVDAACESVARREQDNQPRGALTENREVPGFLEFGIRAQGFFWRCL